MVKNINVRKRKRKKRGGFGVPLYEWVGMKSDYRPKKIRTYKSKEK